MPTELSDVEALQEQRRQELTTYMQQLKQKQSVNGQIADLTFGADFYSLVQRLLQEKKTEYESIRGTVPRL